jgi:hypothetical protein
MDSCRTRIAIYHGVHFERRDVRIADAMQHALTGFSEVDLKGERR